MLKPGGIDKLCLSPGYGKGLLISRRGQVQLRIVSPGGVPINGQRQAKQMLELLSCSDFKTRSPQHWIDTLRTTQFEQDVEYTILGRRLIVDLQKDREPIRIDKYTVSKNCCRYL